VPSGFCNDDTVEITDRYARVNKLLTKEYYLFNKRINIDMIGIA